MGSDVVKYGDFRLFFLDDNRNRYQPTKPVVMSFLDVDYSGGDAGGWHSDSRFYFGVDDTGDEKFQSWITAGNMRQNLALYHGWPNLKHITDETALSQLQ